MKNILKLVAAFCLMATLSANAQNQTIEMKLYDSNGIEMPNTYIDVRLSIIEKIFIAYEETLYTETHYNVQTDNNGLFYLTMGLPTNEDGSLNEEKTTEFDRIMSNPLIANRNKAKIKVEIDPTRDGTYPVSGEIGFYDMFADFCYIAGNANHATEAETALYATAAETAVVADTAETAKTAETAVVADTAGIAEVAQSAIVADTAKIAERALVAEALEGEIDKAKEAEKATKYIGDMPLVPVTIEITGTGKGTVEFAGKEYTASSTEALYLPAYCPVYMKVSCASNINVIVTINGTEFVEKLGTYFSYQGGIGYVQTETNTDNTCGVYVSEGNVWVEPRCSVADEVYPDDWNKGNYKLVGPFTKTDGNNVVKVVFEKQIL